MSRIVATTCDYCGKNVDSVESRSYFVITLGCHQRDGVPNMLLVHPPFDGQMYFCDTGCLKNWLDNGRKPQNYAPPVSSSATSPIKFNKDGTITMVGDFGVDK